MNCVHRPKCCAKLSILFKDRIKTEKKDLLGSKLDGTTDIPKLELSYKINRLLF